MLQRIGLTLLISTLALSLTSPESIASRGGVEDKSNYFSVGFTYNDDGIPSVCSGSLLAPTIILTAGHCVLNSKGNYGSDYLFSAPGVALDAPVDPSITQPKIIKVITKPGFVVSGGNEIDDLAFIVLDKALTAKSFIPIATAEEVAALKDDATINGYGYGFVYESGKSYSSYLRKYPLSWKNLTPISPSTGTFEITSPNAVACRGDSGGPITALLPSGREVLLGVISGAANIVNGCGSQGSDGLYRMRMAQVNPFLQYVKEALEQAKAAPVTTAKKIIKITCVKGKLKKVVSGVKPKCPKGYQLKK